jgi:ppGpp synthetase/RelA/SpoT-type nucleotidyltranferase
VSDYSYVANQLRKDIEDLLFGVGILCRVFGRGKTPRSLKNKIESNPGKYALGSKLIQDAIGIRVALYFPDDVEIVRQILCGVYLHDDASSTIDLPNTEQFSVSRYNLIFRTPNAHEEEMTRNARSLPIDSSFEVQIRTILSEGWHEVEHDLRYKTKANWVGQDDLSRALNGIMATIETSEWSMRRVFDELAHRHYKAKKWAAMLHSKLRMRVSPSLSSEICSLLDADPSLAKALYRIDRKTVVQMLSSFKPRVPVTMDNIVFMWAIREDHKSPVAGLTPSLISEAIARAGWVDNEQKRKV